MSRFYRKMFPPDDYRIPKYMPVNVVRQFILIVIVLPVHGINLMAESGSDALQQNDQTVFSDWKPVGFVQQHFFVDNIEENPLYFSIHRARLGFSGSLTKRINLNIVVGALEPPNRQPALVNAFADFHIHPLVNLRTGQFLVPFGIEGPKLIFLNPAIERAYPTRQMNHYRMFRDVGLMANGEYSFISYSFAVLNGTGANVPENINPKDFVLRTIFSLSPETNAGFSAQTGKIEDNEDKISNRHKWAVHFEYDINPGFIRGEIMRLDIDTNSDSGKERSHGGYLLGGYRFSDRITFISRYEYYNHDNNDALNYQGLTLGGNYFVTSMVRLSINGTTASFSGNNNDIQYVMNIQLQYVL